MNTIKLRFTQYFTVLPFINFRVLDLTTFNSLKNPEVSNRYNYAWFPHNDTRESAKNRGEKRNLLPQSIIGRGMSEARKHYLEFACTFNTVSHYKLERECCPQTIISAFLMKL